MTETRILDRGYRHFEGTRGGVWAAVRSVVRNTTERALGIHRKFRYKVMPLLTIIISYVPHVVYVGIVVLTNQLDERTATVQVGGAPPGMLPANAGRQVANMLIKDYPDTYLNIVAAVALFAAFVGPEVLCTDRRTGMLGLYLSSPLNRWSYLLAKGIAIGRVMLLVTLGPPVLLLIGYSTQGYGPSGVVEWVTTAARVVAAGVGISLFYTMIACALSSITARRAAASAAFVILVIGSGVVVTVLISATQGSNILAAFNLVSLPVEYAYRVFGQPSTIAYYPGMPPVDTNLVYFSFVGWITLSALVIWDRYRRVEVTR
jgi:ABC-2 type transport system permease protein